MARQKTKPVTTAAAKQPVETVVEQPVTPAVKTDEEARRALTSGEGGHPAAQPVSPPLDASPPDADGSGGGGSLTPPSDPTAGDKPVTDPFELAVKQGDAVLQSLSGGEGADTISPATQTTVGEIAANAVEAVKSATEALVNVLTITVRGPAKGRWRAGRHFTPEPTVIPLTDLTEDQVAALDADPELTVLPAAD